MCCLIVFALLVSISQFQLYADQISDSIVSDDIVLTIEVGKDEGQIGYSDNMQGGGEGPEAFTITDDNTIYIVDNVNKRINIYQNGEFVYDIDTPYIAYVRSIEVSQEMVYLMDYDAGRIYVINLDGDLVEGISISENMESYLMQKLYADDDGNVWLYYENNYSGNSSRGVNYSYLVSDMADGEETHFEGFSIDGISSYTVSDMGKKSVSINNSADASINANTDITANGNLDMSADDDIRISTNELLGNVQILDVDKDGCLYLDLFEMIDTSVVCGEYTVRKYLNNECLGVADIDLNNYYFMPNNVLAVSENGELYQIKCLSDQIQIIKKDFVPFEEFRSNINAIKAEALENELRNETASTVSIVNAPNTRNEAMNLAVQCCNLSWTYTANNAINPDSGNITTPDYLVYASKPSVQTGIPYCWGGFDGINTSSSSSWSNFSSAMSSGIFAGNVKTDTPGWQGGTAGLDCSGFISSTAGFSYKLGTQDLATSTYTTWVSVSYRTIYDIYVNSGTHVFYYVGDSTGGIQTREATTEGEEKTKLYIRSDTSLSGYELRRLNGW